ncbi:MAG: hypothetical protein WC876_05070 [Candidatus Thermoplasmatota archaeon]
MDLRRALLVGLALVVLPASAQGPGAIEPLDRLTTLYLHLNGYQDMAMTTQPPPDSYAEDVTIGLAASTLTCLPTLPMSGAQQDYHTRRAFGFQGHVDYSQDPPRQEMGSYGSSRSLAADVPLTGGRMLLHWYWSTDVNGPSDAPDQVPFAVPGVVVEATVRTGDAISIDDEAFDRGQLVAHGRTPAAILAAEQSSGVTYSQVDGRRVYEFQVPLDIGNATLPADIGYNLRIDTYVLRDECPADGALMPNVLAAHTSAEHRPRLEFTADDAPRVELLHLGSLPNAPADRILVAANVSSPWGNPDIAKVQLTITGPVEAISILQIPSVGEIHCHCPPAPLQPVWMWDAGFDGAPPGHYTATLTATSTQGETTVVSQEFTLSGDREMPSLQPVASALVLLLLGLLARRRS